MKLVGWGSQKIKNLSTNCEIKSVKETVVLLKELIESAEDFDDLMRELKIAMMLVQFKSGTMSIWITHAKGCHMIRVTIDGDRVIFKEDRPL